MFEVRREPSLLPYGSAQRRAFHVDADDAKRATDVSPAAPAARVHHLAIPSPQFLCYRVIRQYREHGVTWIEDIGAFGNARLALLLLSTETGRAQVLDPRGKVYADNLQPIEERRDG
jgi:hypothetical protein